MIISAAEELSANTDSLFLLGFLIAVPTSAAGYLYARRLGEIETARASENDNQVHSGIKVTAQEEKETAQEGEAGVKEKITEAEEEVTEIQEKVAEVNGKLTEAAEKITGEKVKEAEMQEKGFGVQRRNEIKRKDAGKPGRLEAYAPVFLPLLLILFQAGFEHPHPLFAFLGNPNVALLIGVILSLFSGRALGVVMVRTLVEKAIRRSGVVLLDLCGGGALGATLAMTGAGEALGRLFLQLNLPHILVPFLVASALQTVQGSRVVTMLVAPSLLLPLVPELGLPPEILILAMASGTFLISHVNDPFFWIFGELAEMEPTEVFRSYTLGGGPDGRGKFPAGLRRVYFVLLKFYLKLYESLPFSSYFCFPANFASLQITLYNLVYGKK